LEELWSIAVLFWTMVQVVLYVIGLLLPWIGYILLGYLAFVCYECYKAGSTEPLSLLWQNIQQLGMGIILLFQNAVNVIRNLFRL